MYNLDASHIMNSSAAALLLLKKPQLLHAIVQTVEPPRTTNKIEKIVIAFRQPEWMLEHTQCAHSLQSVSCVLNANVQKKKKKLRYAGATFCGGGNGNRMKTSFNRRLTNAAKCDPLMLRRAQSAG